MVQRTTVDFTEQVTPIYKKYAKTYGVKTTCSLGAILIHRLKPEQREKLMDLQDLEVNNGDYQGGIISRI